MHLYNWKAVVIAMLAIICVLTPGDAVRQAHADDKDCDDLPAAIVSHQAGSRPQHVFIIVLENESYSETFGPTSKAPYLSKCLIRKGQLLTNYYAIGHFSLDNYDAMISGQSPNPETQMDCPIFDDLALTTPGLDANGQAVGHGCVYPADVKTIASQLEERHLKWRGYMEDMNGTCQHPPIGEVDLHERATKDSQYATKHNPFVYFHSISDKDCKANDVPLDQLEIDLGAVETTPNLSFIVPNLCNDGHDHKNGKCADGKAPGGLVAIDSFLKRTVPTIMNSKAYQQDGMLIITFDEADVEGEERDAGSCCSEPVGPNTQLPGMFGPGGGKIGTVIISSFVKPGIPNSNTYNHYSLLRSLESLFGLSHLGYADKPDPGEFGNDVYSQ